MIESLSYRNKELETAERPNLQALQLKNLKETVGMALKTQFYKKRLNKAGINSSDDINSLADLEKIPFTTKDDLRECYPKGLLAVELDEVVRLHTSSGTTGTPTVIYHTRQDLDNWTELVTRGIVACGVSKKDVLQNMMSYGLFTGGLGLHYGAERLGALVIPASSGNTKRQLKMMKDFQTTMLHITPSYMLHIASRIEEFGFTLDDLNIKKAFLGAEPYSENTRKKIEAIFGIDVYNCYGLSEMNGPGVAMECIFKDGLHVWEDAYLMEIINPKTNAGLEDGQEGEVVFTTLQRRATPLLRYRTRDIAYIFPGICKCKRTHRRISRIIGRTDDMLIINGANVFPSQVEEVLMCMPEVGNNYQIQVEKAGALDKLIVKIEIYSKMFSGDIKQLEGLKRKIQQELRASIVIKAMVELHEPGSLPTFEGKAQRVKDMRPKL